MKPLTYIAALTLMAAFFLPLKVVSYNWNGEDSFISYRVARNFASGQGMVFNPGERVEAQSNFLWTLLLGVGAKLGMNLPLGGRVLSALFACATIFLLGIARPGIFKNGDGVPDGVRDAKVYSCGALALLAPLLFLFDPIVHYLSDRGLETMLHAFLLLLAWNFWVSRKPLAASLALTAVALNRPEGFGFFAVMVALTAFEQRRMRGANAGHAPQTFSRVFWLKLTVPFIALFGAFICWRLSYYGQLLPNTVYAKVTPGNFWRNPALHDVWKFLISWGFVPVLALLALVFPSQTGRDASHAQPAPLSKSAPPVEPRGYLNSLAFMIGGGLAYILLIGKVAAEPFRHFAPLIPFIILLAQELVFQWRGALPRARAFIWLLALILFSLTFYTCDNGDAPGSRLHSRLARFVRRPDPIAAWRRFIAESVMLDARAGRWLAERYPPQTKVVSEQMGQLAYYGNWIMIDSLGLADRHVAHQGFSLDYALSRDPDLCVITFFGDAPAAPVYHGVMTDPRFAERYALRYRLNNRFGDPSFQLRVFVRRRAGEPVEAETVSIGYTEEEFHQAFNL